MDGKTYTFRATEIQEKHIEEEAKKRDISTSVVLRELVEKGRNGKEEIEPAKKPSSEQQELFQKQIDWLISNLGSVRFEVKMLYILKYGKERAKELRLRADEIGQKKLLEVKS